MKLPAYYLMGVHAVRARATPDGGMAIERYVPSEDRFVLDMGRLSRAVEPHAEDDEMTGAEFEAYVAAQRAAANGG